jgi:hypothetical protein
MGKMLRRSETSSEEDRDTYGGEVEMVEDVTARLPHGGASVLLLTLVCLALL